MHNEASQLAVPVVIPLVFWGPTGNCRRVILKGVRRNMGSAPVPANAIHRALWAFATVLLAGISWQPAMAQEMSPDIYQKLSFRHIGPGGNRTDSVVSIPGDPLTYYVGASSGWNLEDHGWRYCMASDLR